MDDDDISILLSEPDRGSRGAAFEAAVKRYWKPLRAHLRTKLGMQNPADQEDVISQAFLELHKLAVEEHGFELDGPPVSALLYKIVSRRALDLYRKRTSENLRITSYEEYVINETLPILREEGAVLEWQQISTRAEIMESFWAALSELPPQQEAAARAVAMLCNSRSRLSAENIRDGMQYITGKPHTILAATSAWRAVRTKFSGILALHRR